MPHKTAAARAAYRKRWWANLSRERRRQYAGSNNLARRRRYRLKERYGLTLDEWEAVFAAQGHCCAICKMTTSSRSNRTWCTDHDHETHKVRGILCHFCNWMLGKMKDDPAHFQAFIDYLQQHRLAHT
jgi:hypothetical protein